MNKDDTNRWDARYISKKSDSLPCSDQLLLDHIELFRPSHWVADLACGRGRHTLVLAKHNCKVIAIDCSQEAIRQCYQHAIKMRLEIYPVVADLEYFRLPQHSVDAIICFNYLNRSLANNIQQSLKPGGVLVMKTFNKNFLLNNPKFNPDYVLLPQELASMFNRLEVIYLDDESRNATNTKSAIVARKPTN